MADSSTNTLSLNVRPDGVGVITYDVPGASVNTLQASFAEQLEAMLSKCEGDDNIKALVLASGKADTWVAGADTRMLSAVKTAAEAEQLSKMAQHGFKRLEEFRKPVVAAIHGAAFGGGLELALACHARVLSDDPKTVVGFPEVKLGVLPAGNGLQRMARMLGLQAALDYGLTGKNMRPAKAAAMGIADKVVARSILIEVAAQRALALADAPSPKGNGRLRARVPFGSKLLTEAAMERNPIGRLVLFRKARDRTRSKTRGHFPAAENIIDVIEAFASKGWDASSELESRLFGERVASETARQLIGIFEATTALKKDRGVEDPKVQPRPVRKVAVLGGGLMGGGITFVTIQNADIPVRVKERDLESLPHAYKQIHELFSDSVHKRQMTQLDSIRKIAMLSGTVDFTGFADTDLVIEAVFEDVELKRKMLQDVEMACKTDTIFASNTSCIPISKIAEKAANPERVVGMHYFSPVHKMPLLEVIRTSKTAPWVVATAVALGKKQGKTAIVVNDGAGFYTSRVLTPLMNEATYLLAEGVCIEDIDSAMRDWGWPVGPITLLDEVGIDIAAHICPILVEALGERMTPPTALQRVVDDNRKGRKNERGFYLYGHAARKKGKGKHVDPSVYCLLGIEPKTRMAPEEIQMRCSLQLINESIRCLGEGIVRSARDGDMAAVLGLGFPPFRGGPFRTVDSMGAPEVLRRIVQYFETVGKRWEPAPLLVEMAKGDKKFYP
jgi:3-hydroxyacyl-CoA dehydrogenase / enoyl-CoA hydratase / 3-hydroxybutyryl-CoA epimerase